MTGEGEAVLEVADRGPGLDPEAAQKVFERFYRADPSRARSGGGSGLGLSIVAAIAEAHGGRATVDSTPGTGACFRVSLPTGHRPAPRAEPADFSPTTGSSPPDPVPEAAVAPLAPPAAPPSASVPVVSSWAAPTSPPAPATEPDD
jgi:hypothetical protein